MQAQSAGSALARSPEGGRTLVASNGAVWIWPGIPLTIRQGHEVLPAAESTIRSWIALLHGVDALHKELKWAVASAAQYLNAGNEIAAQRVLDSLGLISAAPTGAMFMIAVAEEAGAYIPDVFVESQYLVSGASGASLQALRIAGASVSHRLVKAGPWDSSKHPRWLKGAPERQGGRFKPSDSADEPSSASEPPPRSRPLTVYSRKPPTIGHNQGPALEEPPKIPPEPVSGSARIAFIRLAAKWLTAALEISEPEAGAFLAILQASSWIAEQCLPYIEAYFTQPKTLEELQHDANFPEKGYDIHHTGEKAQAAADGVPVSVWNAPENKVRVPTLKHWEITGWYMTKNKDFGGVSPRDYLRGKSWDEKVRVGRDALIRYKVLKP
jgi:hypothetical protein